MLRFTGAKVFIPCFQCVWPEDAQMLNREKTMQTSIKIRIHKSIMDRVLDYCTYEHFSPEGDEYYIVHFPFIENEYYYNMLLGFGNKCGCLEPLSIRDEMKRRIYDVAALYED